MSTVATRLAAWAVALAPDEADQALAERALRDTLAVGLVAREHRILRVGAALDEAGRWAAASHVVDFDDLHMPSTTHISTVCVPAALATDGGPDAYLAGAGVMARVGTALGWRHYSAGWHATTTAGVFGAAVIGARAHGLDVDGVARALALAVPAAGGVQRAFGTDAKSLQVGLAVDAGLRAAALAAAGASADPAAMDDWLLLVGGDPAAVRLDGPAVPGGLAIKLYPACYALQRPISALRTALDARDGARMDPATVRSIRVRTPAASVQPLIHHRPDDGLQGKFSLEYALAATVLDAHPGFEAFTDAGVRREEARRLVGLVETTLSDDGGESLLTGQVEIELHTDTEVVTASLQHPPGSPERPPTDEELGEKVEACLAGSGVDPAELTWADGAALLRRRLVGPPTPS